MRRTGFGARRAGVYVLGGIGLIACAAVGVREVARPTTVSSGGSLPEVAIAECDLGGEASIGSGAARPRGNPAARQAAQRALSFLSDEVARWQGQHDCYGCHVQAVSLEAYVVGRHNGYDVPSSAIPTALRGMLELEGGARTDGGLSHQGGSVPETSNAFGGAAFAHYDERVDTELSDDLMSVATRLEELQNAEGWVSSGNWITSQVDIGAIQTTTQAIQTWRQAYARSADDRWLRPLRKAEDWMQGQAMELVRSESAEIQKLNYATLGLLAAGATGSEETLHALSTRVADLQSDTGSWGSPLLTGQSLYALRSAGRSDDDPVIAKGTSWLLESQQDSGGWGQGGAARAEAMWAVLGLVSLDVASVELVEGPADGAHVSGTTRIVATGADNEGGAVRRMDLIVDDRVVASVCGDRLDHRLNASALSAGPHLLELVATTSAGRSGRRMLGVYAGDYYVTGFGSRSTGDRTEFSWRNLSGGSGRVRLDVFDEDGRRVHREELDGRQGPMQAAFESETRGRYTAKLHYLRDDDVIQTEELPFVHDTEDVQRSQFGEVTGSLSAGGSTAEGAIVELVDDEGNVVQQTRSTRSGNYRFRNVDQGRYRVRARRQGWHADEQSVEASPAAAAEVDFDLH